MRAARSCSRVRRRVGIITARSPEGGYAVGGVANSPVGRHSAGTSSRLPGRVTYLCPVGEVHTTVPSKTCPPATGSRWAADTPRPDAEANHYRDSIADTVPLPDTLVMVT